jgi:hypothetical protein
VTNQVDIKVLDGTAVVRRNPVVAAAADKAVRHHIPGAGTTGLFTERKHL